jgi:putative flippase GtrA
MQLAARIDATIIRFAVVGAITTVIDFVLFATLIGITGQPVLSNIISYSCGLTTSYLLNRSWTFAVEADLIQALKFFLFTSTGLLLSTLLVALLSLALPPLAAKLLSVPIVFFWNYLTARYLVFAPAVVSQDGDQTFP